MGGGGGGGGWWCMQGVGFSKILHSHGGRILLESGADVSKI